MRKNLELIQPREFNCLFTNYKRDKNINNKTIDFVPKITPSLQKNKIINNDISSNTYLEINTNNFEKNEKEYIPYHYLSQLKTVKQKKRIKDKIILTSQNEPKLKNIYLSILKESDIDKCKNNSNIISFDSEEYIFRYNDSFDYNNLFENINIQNERKIDSLKNIIHKMNIVELTDEIKNFINTPNDFIISQAEDLVKQKLNNNKVEESISKSELKNNINNKRVNNIFFDWVLNSIIHKIEVKNERNLHISNLWVKNLINNELKKFQNLLFTELSNNLKFPEREITKTNSINLSSNNSVISASVSKSYDRSNTMNYNNNTKNTNSNLNKLIYSQFFEKKNVLKKKNYKGLLNAVAFKNITSKISNNNILNKIPQKMMHTEQFINQTDPYITGGDFGLYRKNILSSDLNNSSFFKLDKNFLGFKLPTFRGVTELNKNNLIKINNKNKNKFKLKNAFNESIIKNEKYKKIYSLDFNNIRQLTFNEINKIQMNKDRTLHNKNYNNNDDENENKKYKNNNNNDDKEIDDKNNKQNKKNNNSNDNENFKENNRNNEKIKIIKNNVIYNSIKDKFNKNNFSKNNFNNSKIISDKNNKIERASEYINKISSQIEKKFSPRKITQSNNMKTDKKEKLLILRENNEQSNNKNISTEKNKKIERKNIRKSTVSKNFKIQSKTLGKIEKDIINITKNIRKKERAKTIMNAQCNTNNRSKDLIKRNWPSRRKRCNTIDNKNVVLKEEDKKKLRKILNEQKKEIVKTRKSKRHNSILILHKHPFNKIIEDINENSQSEYGSSMNDSFFNFNYSSNKIGEKNKNNNKNINKNISKKSEDIRSNNDSNSENSKNNESSNDNSFDSEEKKIMDELEKIENENISNNSKDSIYTIDDGFFKSDLEEKLIIENEINQMRDILNKDELDYLISIMYNLNNLFQITTKTDEIKKEIKEAKRDIRSIVKRYFIELLFEFLSKEEIFYERVHIKKYLKMKKLKSYGIITLQELNDLEFKVSRVRERKEAKDEKERIIKEKITRENQIKNNAYIQAVKNNLSPGKKTTHKNLQLFDDNSYFFKKKKEKEISENYLKRDIHDIITNNYTNTFLRGGSKRKSFFQIFLSDPKRSKKSRYKKRIPALKKPAKKKKSIVKIESKFHSFLKSEENNNIKKIEDPSKPDKLKLEKLKEKRLYDFFKKIQQLKNNTYNDDGELTKFIDEEIEQLSPDANNEIRITNFMKELDFNRMKAKYYFNFKNKNISFLSPIVFKSTTMKNAKICRIPIENKSK